MQFMFLCGSTVFVVYVSCKNLCIVLVCGQHYVLHPLQKGGSDLRKLLNRIRSNQGSINPNLIVDTFEVHFLPILINCSFSLPLLYMILWEKGRRKSRIVTR